MFLLPLVVLMNLLMSIKVAYGQNYRPSNRVPIADTTLGTTVAGSNGSFTVTGGIQRGQNLFHSFQDFSIPTNGSTTFVNPVGNQSIITRVTGSSFSDINGTLNTQGANFLLINPNGVVFGPNTTLNVGRVFAASTANSVDLVDGSGRSVTFGTNTAGDAPLLTVNPNVLFNVSRLNLGGGNGSIRNFGNLQTSNPNQYVGLVGGNVAIDEGRISAPGGKIELGGLSAPGAVGLTVVGNNPRLSFPVGVARSNVSLINQAELNVVGTSGGDITINARNIDISGDSLIRGGLRQQPVTQKTSAGDVNLSATGLIEISNSTIVNGVFNSQGSGGNINIYADALTLQQGTRLVTGTFGQGSAGDINVTTLGAFTITGTNTVLTSFTESQANGNGGNIIINTPDRFIVAKNRAGAGFHSWGVI